MTSTLVSTIDIALALGLSPYQSFVQPAEKPNVLFITIDDMNDWISVFGKNNPIKVTNIEKLAERGAFFTHAYCSSPACNPSRASVMTRTRPHKTGMYGNSSDWRNALPAIKTHSAPFLR